MGRIFCAQKSGTLSHLSGKNPQEAMEHDQCKAGDRRQSQTAGRTDREGISGRSYLHSSEEMVFPGGVCHGAGRPDP